MLGSVTAAFTANDGYGFFPISATILKSESGVDRMMRLPHCLKLKVAKARVECFNKAREAM